MNEIYLQVGIIKDITDLTDVKNVLSDMTVCDNDFTGENGAEYLWESAKEKGFETNLDYVLAEVLKPETLHSNKDGYKQGFYFAVKKFFDMWLGNDGYYRSYNWQIEEVENNPLSVVIALAYTVQN